VSSSLPDPYPGVGESIGRLNAEGWLVVVVTNQTAVARGLITEIELQREHLRLAARLRRDGGHIEDFRYCPHHPDATLEQYRIVCQCRKPRPGLLIEAAVQHGGELSRSVMIGDRPTDVEAGHRAGCATVLIESGRQNDPRIAAVDPPSSVEPDARFPDLSGAVGWILGRDL
jgi:D-glycero-D-manno-heptose 1,7-bisphosphate phosphatase